MADPWGAPAAFGAPAPSYGVPAPAPAVGYGPAVTASGGFDFAAPGPAPVPAPYGGPPQDPFAAPASQPFPSSNPFGAPPPQQPPAPYQQQPLQLMYGQPPPQPPAPFQQQQPPNPFGSPAPNTVSTAQDYTPASSIGFASPMAYSSQPPDQAPEPEPAPVEPTQPSADPALMSMGVLSGQAPTFGSVEPQSNGTGGSLADLAYSKFANMDAFDLVKDKAEQKNPFEFSSNSSNAASLADMKKNTDVSLIAQEQPAVS